VHAHTGRAQNLAFLATAGLRQLPLKRIVTRHVAFTAKHPLIRGLKYSLTCDGVIAVSRAARDAMLSAGVSGDRIEIIATGVEIPRLPDPEEREAARKHWGLAPQDFAAGHLGAFTAEKGQDVAAEAARLLEHRLPALRLILAGEGPLRASLPSAQNLILPGHLDDPASLLAALDVFVMPSRSEAWGLAALEAMAFGLPVIASNTGGLAEMIDPGETGWLVPAGDAAALAEALIAAAADREKLAAKGTLARSRAARFGVEETVRRTEEFYLRILNSPKI
jgi:glycosyltransferase involved in cell wall biosynthesis